MERITACMKGDASKLHGNLLKYKIKFRSIDQDLRQPIENHYAGGRRGGGVCCAAGPKRMRNLVQCKSDYLETLSVLR